MAFTNLSTRSTGYLVTAANWNELVNNWLTVATSAGLIKHEFGGIEADISAIAAGGILRGSGTGTMAILGSFLNGSGNVTHEFGGIEADISAIAAGGIVRGSGTGTMAILTKGSALQVLRVNAGASDLEYATLGSEHGLHIHRSPLNGVLVKRRLQIRLHVAGQSNAGRAQNASLCRWRRCFNFR